MPFVDASSVLGLYLDTASPLALRIVCPPRVETSLRVAQLVVHASWLLSRGTGNLRADRWPSRCRFAGELITIREDVGRHKAIR
jgi:hypothetical protein